MHLINQKLSGREVPFVLPAELIPPSERDLDQLTNILKMQIVHETRSRATDNIDFQRYSPPNSAPPKSRVASISSLESDLSKINDVKQKNEQNEKRIQELIFDIDKKEKKIKESEYSIKQLKEEIHQKNLSSTLKNETKSDSNLNLQNLQVTEKLDTPVF
jgi:predicted RNase H-like nuclease (RuvC/YqgF family)